MLLQLIFQLYTIKNMEEEKIKKIMLDLERKLFQKLEEKPSWGKEQLKKMFLQIKSDVLLDNITK